MIKVFALHFPLVLMRSKSKEEKFDNLIAIKEIMRKSYSYVYVRTPKE